MFGVAVVLCCLARRQSKASRLDSYFVLDVKVFLESNNFRVPTKYALFDGAFLWLAWRTTTRECVC